MKPAFLGFDTSCYTTSCAAVDGEGRVLVSARKLLPVALGERGLRQSEAVFSHIRQMPDLFHRTMEALNGYSVKAVCVSDRPVDGDDSYMPVFMAGCAFARTAADALGARCFFTTHQRGHLAAAQIGMELIQKPYIALHLSGGTTDFMLVDERDRIAPFAAARDLHAGQLVDRVGVMLGLPFPAGRHLETLAEGTEAAGRYAAVIKDGDCCLSGAEAQARRDAEGGLIPPGQIAAEVYDVLTRSILKVLDAHQMDARRVLAAGGVASSLRLRAMLDKRIAARRLPYRFFFGEPQYSADNAAGVASICRMKYLNSKEG